MAEVHAEWGEWFDVYDAEECRLKAEWENHCSSVAQGDAPVSILQGILQHHQETADRNLQSLDGFATRMSDIYMRAVLGLNAKMAVLMGVQKDIAAISELLTSTGLASGDIESVQKAVKAAKEAKVQDLERLESASQIALREVSRRRSTVPMAPVASQADDITVPEVTEQPSPDIGDEIDEESDAQPSRSSDPSSSSTRPRVRATGQLRTVNTL